MAIHEDTIQIPELFSLRGKVALVTGGSRGIGAMITRGYLEAGAKVYISARKREACDRASEEFSAFGPCFSIPGDVSSAAGCRTLASAIAEQESALHILVNNAGAAWGATLEEYPEEGFDKVMDTNVKSIF